MSSTGLDLMQTSGFTVVADKINYMRFLTHFRRYGSTRAGRQEGGGGACACSGAGRGGGVE